MSEISRRHLVIVPMHDHEPEIGRWIWALEDTRQETKDCLKDVGQAVLDWTPPEGGNSIGTILYHIAMVEMDWLYAEVLQAPEPWPAEITGLFAVDMRDDGGRLSVVKGAPLADHMRLLELVRTHLLATYRTMTIDDFRRARSLPDYDVTPEWVLHHLIQHEAEHRGQLQSLRTWAEQAV